MRLHNPDFLCLAETKISVVDVILNRLGFFHFVNHPPVGRKGGLIFA